MKGTGFSPYMETEKSTWALAPAGCFPIPRALAIARGVAQGLAAAHAKGIIHRDVKPENILLANPDTPAETPKLLDFGIAAVHETVTAVSRTHGLMLTPPYASPEQWRGTPADQLDGRADLYALGGVLYEMLTGQTPFQAHNSEGWMYQHLQEQPQPPSNLRPELANWQGLDALVVSLLAKDREQRPRDAAELVGLLDAVRYVAPDARQETVSEDAAPAEKQREIRRSGRVPVWVWTASVLALLAAAFAAGRIFWPKPPATTRSGVTGVPPGLVEEPFPQAQPSSQPASTPAAGGWQISDSPTPPQPSTQEPNSATDPYAAIAKPPGSPQPSSQPTSKGGLAPWEEEPSNAEAEKLAMRFYNQHRSKEAAPLFKQACSGGIAEGCWFLGIMYGTGQGVPKSEATAVALLSKACDAGMAIGCYDAALGYTSGKGIGKDYQRAALLYSKACDADIGPACSNLSDIYALGAGGIEPDIPRAQELARKACTVKKIPPSACSIPEIKQ
jgi:serine/threonine protein kinase